MYFLGTVTTAIMFLAISSNHYARSVRIIWDNSVDMNTLETYEEYGPNAVVRMPNWFLIFPGTKWCGPGNIATTGDANDLGKFRDTDRCCRNHDLCPDPQIKAFQTKYNLTNPSLYSRLTCNCDQAFRLCLKAVDSTVSTQIGQIYFTALGTKCYKKEYPIRSCKKYTYFLWRKCVQYVFDTTKRKVYQWFDMPNY